jgi:uncharacterized protein (TIGR04255 family)
VSKKNEIYKNAPLIETVFEIRFLAEPAIECNRDKLYKRIRNIYSKVLVPGTVPGKATAFEPYRFENTDGNNGIMLSIDKLAFYCKKYEGFNSFKKETMRLFFIFEELFKIQKLRRAGLRYINIIPFVRENDIIPIENYLNIKIVLPNSITTDFKNLSLIFVSPTKEGGSLTTRIESAISNDKKQEGIILDFDYAQEGDLYFSQIDKYLEGSHNNTKYIFEQLIADNYKKVMWGEVI